ncbi:cytidylate kinase family protein [Candidatus Uhrbacteria bacterium]|nr:cytidylate kinase family protein [Candidatus Uhrbacteria bacterium]
MIITLSGLPGSGKSTVGRRLAERLGYRFYSMGDLRGKMALERHLTIDELNVLGEKEEWTDREVDEYQEKLGKTEDNLVIDGRLSFHFIPPSFKIFLTVDPRVGAERIFARQRPDEKTASSIEELQKQLQERVASDEARYGRWYGLNFRHPKNFDLVIDSTNLAPEEVVNRILKTLP